MAAVSFIRVQSEIEIAPRIDKCSDNGIRRHAFAENEPFERFEFVVSLQDAVVKVISRRTYRFGPITRGSNRRYIH
jgi:hypothetical protein